MSADSEVPGGSSCPSNTLRIDAAKFGSEQESKPALSSEANDDASDLIIDLANEYLERYRAGANPDIDHYKRDYPDLADRIDEVFPMMLLMEDNAPSGTDEARSQDSQLDRLGDFKIRRVIGRGGMGIVYEALQESLGRHVALKVCPATVQMSPRNSERFRRESRAAAMLHHTNIVPVFAVGEEDGRLFYAMQFIRGASLDEVIRELRKLWQSSPTATTRLNAGSAEPKVHSEASEVARSLFGSGAVSDEQAFAEEASIDAAHETLEPVSFPSKTTALSADVSLPGVTALPTSSGSASHIGKYWESVAKIGMQVANALAYAHAQGTLHRDIKPANLMLDQAGIVWVMDFGLAKSTEEDDLTRDGEMIGTLRYMAPEQCVGQPESRSDVYSLGLTLYELLALQPAFKELHRSQLIRAIAERDPVPPRKINSNVPKDLETIVLKAIEKEPAKRYASPSELERDLQRFLVGEPIKARAITNLERLHKWIRRRPLVSGLTAALATLFLVSFGLVAWSWLRAEEALVDANIKTKIARSAQKAAGKNQTLAEERLEIAESALYRAAIDRVKMLSETDAQSAGELLDQLIPGSKQTDRRGWEWGYLQALVHQHVAVFDIPAPQAEWIWDLTFSHDDSLIAVATGRPEFVRPRGVSPKGRATFWDTRTAKMVCELPVEHSAYDIAFSHDSRFAAVSEAIATNHFETGWEGFVQIWELESREVVTKLELPKDQRVYRLRFSADDRLVLGTIWNRNRIQHARTAAWDAETGEQVWSADLVTLTELADSNESDTIEAIEYYYSESPPENYPDLARRVMLDVETGERLAEPIETVAASALYSPGLGLIVDCVDGGDLALRSLGDGTLRKQLRGTEDHLINQKSYYQPVCAVHEGRGLITTGATDGSICVWDVTKDRPVRVLHGHPDRVQSLAISHDGEWIASGDWSGQVRIWRPDSRPEYVRCETPTKTSNYPGTEAIAFRWGGSGIAVYQEKRIEVYEAESGRLLKLHWIAGIPQVASRREACFDEAGNQLAVVQKDQTIAIYDVESGSRVHSTEPLDSIANCVSMSGDGRVLVACCPASESDSESILYCWSFDETKSAWSLIERRRFSRGCHELSLNSDGSRLLVGARSVADQNSQGGFVHSIGLVQMPTLNAQWIELELEPDAMFPPDRMGISALDFSADSRRFAFATTDGNAGIFATSDPDREMGWKPIAEMKIPPNVEQLHWHPNGDRIAGANRDDVTVWNLAGEEVLKLSRGPRPKDYQFDGCVRFSPDGRKLAANRFDNDVSIWSTLRYPDQLSTRKRRLRAEERAKESIDKAIAQSPQDPWYLSVRGRITADLRPPAETLADYLNAKRMICGEPCLFLHGEARIVAPSLPFHEFSGFTIEAWVQRWSHSIEAHESPIATQFRPLRSRSYADLYASRVQARSGIRLPSPRLQADHWVHVALCNDGENERLFVNGVLANEAKCIPTAVFAPPVKTPFFVGDSIYRNAYLPKGEGLIRAVRVSSRVLYQDGFVPESELTNHEGCELLFDFSRDQAETETRITDRSGNERHGRLIDAWWIPKRSSHQSR
ncbi:MAG: protein kinase [Planctomycetota bacterium]